MTIEWQSQWFQPALAEQALHAVDGFTDDLIRRKVYGRAGTADLSYGGLVPAPSGE